MLKLQLLTDPKWANVAEDNIREILIDHAFCEQKAASNAAYRRWLHENIIRY